MQRTIRKRVTLRAARLTKDGRLCIIPPGNAWSEENSDCAALNVEAIGYLPLFRLACSKGHHPVTRTRREQTSSGRRRTLDAIDKLLRGGLVADYRPHAPLRCGHDANQRNGAARPPPFPTAVKN
jgi:hypothetical protein